MRKTQKTKNIIIVLLIMVIVALSAVFVGTQMNAKKKEVTGNLIVDNRATDKEVKTETNDNFLSGRNIYFSGIEDAVINKNTVVQLDNSKDNLDFYMKYEICDTKTGEKIFETDLIPSGQHIDWIPGETLSPGVYDLSFNEIPYYEQSAGDFVSLTKGCNTVTIEIAE